MARRPHAIETNRSFTAYGAAAWVPGVLLRMAVYPLPPHLHTARICADIQGPPRANMGSAVRPPRRDFCNRLRGWHNPNLGLWLGRRRLPRLQRHSSLNYACRACMDWRRSAAASGSLSASGPLVLTVRGRRARGTVCMLSLHANATRIVVLWLVVTQYLW